jgi:hypothetical protein
MFIYKTTNLINGKIYIGQSIFEPEEKPNYLGSGSKLHKAIKEFGICNFKREILETNINDTRILNEREIYWISYFDSKNSEIGYNVLSGGSYENKSEVLREVLNLPEELERKSKESKKIWRDEDYRKKVTESNRKTWSDPELKKKHSELKKQNYLDPKYKESLKLSYENMEILECPHCKKSMKKNHAISKHFDNCIYHTDPTKKKIALERYNLINQNTKKIECPFCNKTGNVGNMNRWHFENCKHKNVNNF